MMFNHFNVDLKLGNAAMQSGPDVARVLREIADRIENDYEARGTVRDENGNTVGTFGAS
jgi:hypothetical protein